jgi:hypothetical protein
MGRKKTMIHVSPSQVTPQIKELLDPDARAGLRCFVVLDAQSVGQAWVDTLFSPDSGIVREAAFGSLYFGDALDAATINDMISTFKDEGDVLVGPCPDDDLWERLPRNLDYVGSVLEFSHRVVNGAISLSPQPPPERCQLRHVTSDLFKRSMMTNYLIRVFGSLKKALERGTELSVMSGKELLSAGSAGPSANGILEVRVATTARTINKLLTSGTTHLCH